MTVKLTPIQTKTPKNKYHILLHIMHGDADFYEDIEVPCKNEADFERKMLAMKDQPMGGSEGGDERKYSKWLEDTFGEGWVPYDQKYEGSGNHAKVDRATGFYFNEHGTKFIAEVVA